MDICSLPPPYLVKKMSRKVVHSALFSEEPFPIQTPHPTSKQSENLKLQDSYQGGALSLLLASSRLFNE